MDIANYVERKFHTSSYTLDRPLLKRKKQKSNWVNEKWIRWKNNDNVCYIQTKNPKGAKICVIKRKLIFDGNKHYSEATQLKNKINQLKKNKLDGHILQQNHKDFIKKTINLC